jgi:phage N-6-adenine-methyltransferase
MAKQMPTGRFLWDLAADCDNNVCDDYFTIEDDSLAQPWDFVIPAGESHFCNPPYSKPLPWVQKAAECRLVNLAFILNLDCSTEWYKTAHDAGATFMPIVGKRVHFLGADGLPMRQTKKCQVMIFFYTDRIPGRPVYKPVLWSDIFLDDGAE